MKWAKTMMVTSVVLFGVGHAQGQLIKVKNPLPSVTNPLPSVPNPLANAEKAAREKAELARKEAEKARANAEKAAREKAELARKEAEKAAREKAELAKREAEKVEKAAREKLERIEELKKEAQKAINEVENLKKDMKVLQGNLQNLEKSAKSADKMTSEEAIRQLRNIGLMQTNKDQFKRNIEKGLSMVVWGKEFDFIEQQKFVTALSLSVATSNPGPVMLYIEGFLLQTKATVLKSLKSLSAEAREKIQKEFDKIFIEALNSAINGKSPKPVTFNGVTLTLDLATYNHWNTVKLHEP